MEKQYSTAECDFAIEWADRWFQLNQLLWDLFRFDETPSPPPPTENQELKYQDLHLWFINHEPQFTPLWRDFWESLHAGEKGAADVMTADGYVEILSSFCYHPQNLHHLVCKLGIQNEMDRWLPNEEKAWKKMMDLTQISHLVKAFSHWR
ncbi:hypothetical protein ACFLW8_03360 [Chloroflexota bacterium]